jgi:hypothetical protein
VLEAVGLLSREEIDWSLASWLEKMKQNQLLGIAYDMVPS